MPRARVLLADDEPAMRQLLKGYFSEDYDVVGTAQDGPTLITAALQLHPDIIITDINMPGLNGIQAIRQLRELASQAKVLFLTSHADLEHKAAAFRAGASGYVIKGEQPDLLYNLSRAIDALLSRPEQTESAQATVRT